MSLSKKVISRIQKMFTDKVIVFRASADWNGGLSNVDDTDLELLAIYDSLDEAIEGIDTFETDPFFFALDVAAGEVRVIQQGGTKVTDVICVV